MQDPAMFQSMMKLPQFPEQEQIKCPRCDSSNTKFCYYNNYNLSQPRHFCKSCRRYWTKGGALRNIPVGGGTRKTNSKKPNTKKASSSSSTSSFSPAPTVPKPEPEFAAGQMVGTVPAGSFNPPLPANGQFGNSMEAAHHTQELVFGEYVENESLSGSDQVSGTNGWPHLAILRTNSRFQ